MIYFLCMAGMIFSANLIATDVALVDWYLLALGVLCGLLVKFSESGSQLLG
jgi:hypothetical protein